jgi:hypothetical protein
LWRLAEVKIKARKKATKDPTTYCLLSDDQESKDKSGVAESHDLMTSPKQKGKFNQKSANKDTDEWHVPPAVQASVDDMGDVGQGSDGEENNLASLSLSSDTENLASLSFSSDTEYLAETYIIIDSEVKQNGSLALGSLLRPGTMETVMLVLDKQFVERTVFFPVYARSFLARGRLFEMMIEDLFKHRANQNDKPHLVLSAQVPRLKHIAHKRMGYLRATYRLFKDMVYETEDNRALEKSHMKMCVKYYHTLIPQLDLIESQWGDKIEDALSHNELGSPRLKREKQKRQGTIEQQLRNQAKEPRKRMTSAPNYAETLEKFRAGNNDGLSKRERRNFLVNQA